jgi:hypothetical protein
MKAAKKSVMIFEALEHLKEKAHITHSDSVTRISGSYLYNKTLDNKSIKE